MNKTNAAVSIFLQDTQFQLRDLPLDQFQELVNSISELIEKAKTQIVPYAAADAIYKLECDMPSNHIPKSCVWK